MRIPYFRRMLARTPVLLLLVALAGLAALAKHSEYLPKSNPTHYFSNAAKMRVAHLPVIFVSIPKFPVARVIPPQPEPYFLPLVEPQKLDLPQIGLTVSLQHRSPPFSIA